ncbi:2Fe-2S iron-sulfur cluster-binding protein [Peristeroidobacter soli]|uniref:2Fe-2S iron-sulfur cluster-binding protein n=1 Tax=Peristeroidobacter soli TaxID=2497877 RepID=UPI00101CEB5F|nr:2Fe-2S iron-sulfur cluster-binding protein [Peristeroidobacter soli]
MTALRVVDMQGNEHRVDGLAGRKLMEALREFDFGVAAICGGMCSCATCHVYIDPEWLSRLQPAEPAERDLLAELRHARPNSRLSCQIDLTDALNDLALTIAPEE